MQYNSIIIIFWSSFLYCQHIFDFQVVDAIKDPQVSLGHQVYQVATVTLEWMVEMAPLVVLG